MLEVKHRYIDFSKRVIETRFLDEYSKLYKKDSYVKFSETQMRLLMSEIYAISLFGLFANQNEKIDSRKIVYDKYPLAFYYKRFALYLLNSISDDAKANLQALTKSKYYTKGLFSNIKLLDYVELVLIDPTFSYRKAEFGRFTIKSIAELLFDEKERNILKARTTLTNYNFENFLKSVGKNLDRGKDNIYPHEKRLIGFAIAYELQQKLPPILNGLWAVEIVQENLLSLNNRLDILKGFYKKMQK